MYIWEGLGAAQCFQYMGRDQRCWLSLQVPSLSYALSDAHTSHRILLAIKASSNDSVEIQPAFTLFAVPASVSSADSAKAAIATMPIVFIS